MKSMNKISNEIRTICAERAGRLAFEKQQPCIPVVDDYFMTLIRGCSDDEVCEMSESWQHAWMRENLRNSGVDAFTLETDESVQGENRYFYHMLTHNQNKNNENA
jgi:hypothetical protein